MTSTLLSDNWYTLRRFAFDYRGRQGNWVHQEREVYDRGNGAAILLYNRQRNTVILTRQFRLPTFVNGNPDGMLIETCAGLLDQDAPEDCIRRECVEETGYHISAVTKLFELYMSPGSVTELLHFFIAEYDASHRRSAGGGVAEEQEEIEVLELAFGQALEMVQAGTIRDAKTVLLLYHLQLSKVLEPTNFK